jgi:hypothetical protein
VPHTLGHDFAVVAQSSGQFCAFSPSEELQYPLPQFVQQQEPSPNPEQEPVLLRKGAEQVDELQL